MKLNQNVCNTFNSTSFIAIEWNPKTGFKNLRNRPKYDGPYKRNILH